MAPIRHLGLAPVHRSGLLDADSGLFRLIFGGADDHPEMKKIELFGKCF